MSEWISVKDRLPESSQKVLVCYSGKVRTLLYSNGQWFGDPDHIGYHSFTPPDSWMPLPEPPSA